MLDTTRLDLALKDRVVNPTTVDLAAVPKTRDGADELGALRQDLLFKIEEAKRAFAEVFTDVIDRYEAHVADLNDEISTVETTLKTFHKIEIAVALDLKQEPDLTIDLPHVTLASSKGQPKWTYFDEDAFKAFVAEKIPTAVKPPVIQIYKNVAKKILADDGTFADESVTFKGAVVPGVKVEPAKREFRVR